MVTMMWHQAPGSPTANHGLFHRYNIEAVTLNSAKSKHVHRTSGYTEMGRVIEGVVRSLNNLLERFHQSFFFYLLPSTDRYVSIGLYMPPFGLMAAPILIKALALWIAFCYENEPEKEKEKDETEKEKEKEENEKDKEKVQELEEEDSEEKSADIAEQMDEKSKKSPGFFSISPVMIMALIFGIITYNGAEYAIVTSNAFRMEPGEGLMWGAFALTLSAALFPKMMERKTRQKQNMVGPNKTLLKCLGLLTLGVVLATTALMNISLAVFVTLVWVPVFLLARPITSRFGSLLMKLLVLMVSPLGLAVIGSVGHQVITNGNKLPSIDKLIAGSTATLKQSLVLGVIESQMIGNWTYGLVTLALLPTWLIFWAVLW